MSGRKFTFPDALKYLTLLIGVFVVLFPPYVVIVNSFKSSDEFNTASTMALPQSFFNFENFKIVFERGGLLSGFGNTLVIICVSLVFNILFGTMVAYVLGRFSFKLKKRFSACICSRPSFPALRPRSLPLASSNRWACTTRWELRSSCTSART
ncbi:hypothetical protein HMSSN036_12360 [Paenibacillus macerans]|nr:hypothetical protein HMSSN036_12360 [Paenibacillus macerans]